MRILIISEYIAPLRSIASVRWTKISKYLKQIAGDDIEIVVLTDEKNYDDPNRMLPLMKKDTLLEQEIDVFDMYWQVPVEKEFRWQYELKKKLTGSVNVAFHQEGGKEESGNGTPGKEESGKKRTRSGKLSRFLSELAFEYRNAVIGKKALEFLLDKGETFDIVISSCGPIWPHMVAKGFKRAQKDVFWIADFRDTYAQLFYTKPIFHWHKHLSRKYTTTADCVSRVDNSLVTYAKERIPHILITNGYDPKEAAEPLPSPKFSIVFTGTLYGEMQDFSVLFQAVFELVSEGKVDSTDVEMIYAGASSAIARSFAEKADALHYFKDLGFLPREDALLLQREAAILLQSRWCVSYERAGLTGKMYEYIMSKKPVIYIVNSDEEFSGMREPMEKTGGYCYESFRHKETFSGLKQYILDKYIEWRQTGRTTVQQDTKYVEQFAYPNIAKQVLALLKEHTKEAEEL